MPLRDSGSLARSVVRALADAPTAADAVDAVLQEIATALDSPLVVLWLFDETSGLLQLHRDWSGDESVAKFREVCRRLSFSEGVGLIGEVQRNGTSVQVLDVGNEPDFPRGGAAAAAGLKSVLATPLINLDRTIGVLEAFSRSDDAIADDRRNDVEIAGRQLAAYLGRVEIEERLEASEERAASIVAAALDCIVTIDQEGRVLDFNAAAEKTFGHRRADVVGESLAELIVPPELRDAHRTAIDRYLETRKPTILNRRLELEAIRADGTRLPVELTVSRLGSREPPTFVGFIRDITERQRAASERERLLSEALSSREIAETAHAHSTTAQVAAERARSESELAGMRLAVLAKAGERMLATRDYEALMQDVVELAVPVIADWCAITIVDDGGSLRTVAVAHADPQQMGLAQELTERYGPVPEGKIGPASVIRSGRVEILDHVDDEHLREVAHDAEHLDMLRKLAPRSALTVPLRSPRRVFGALTLAMSESGRSFDAEDIAMCESLGARAALAIENARLFRDRSHIAETLQRSLLPEELPSVDGLDLATCYRAAGEAYLVGGDFYDVFESGDGVWTAILGDVSGKGPEAAALTALTRHTLRAGALRETSPRANLRLLNEALLATRSEHASRFATVVYTRVCPNEGGGATVTVSAGGHPPPLILRADGALESLPVSGTLLGALPDVDLVDVDLELGRGDLMLLYTDGVIELRPREPGFGEALLRDTLVAHAGASCQEIVAAVERAAVEAQDGEPRDDMALIALRVLAG